MGHFTSNDLATGFRFLRTIGPFLRRRVTPFEARSRLENRLASRESDFLSLMKSAVYANPGSPYLPLLKNAGCSLADLQRSVEREGLEGTLRLLFREGVYFTVGEFKGRQGVRRGQAAFEVRPVSFRNPGSGHHLQVQSGGSTGRSLPVLIDLAYVRERAIDHLLALEARGAGDWVHAVWGVPGNTDMVRILELCSLGAPPQRWFCQVDPYSALLHPRYRWSARAMRWAGRLRGAAIPSPEFVPLDKPGVVVNWAVRTLAAGRTPHLITWASTAVRLCLAARAANQDLSGVQFSVGGEPVTKAKLDTIRAAGAEAVPRFLAMECGYIGYGCLRPSAPDDLHLLSDLQAVILLEEKEAVPGSGLPPGALLLTSLRPSAPFILLNVSLGDQAQPLSGSCGCSLESLGWSQRIRNVRSHEKLTAAGMTFLDADVVRVLEEVLPGILGGTMFDYQLVEEEGTAGEPKLTLLVSPAVGPVDSRRVKDIFLESLGAGSGVERVMSLNWRAGGILNVERRMPTLAASGKIIHLLKTRP